MKRNPYLFYNNPAATACVGVNGGTNDNYIRTGYQEAVEGILERIKKTGYEDILIYPLIFSARHSIELGLKLILQGILIIHELKNAKYGKIFPYNAVMKKNHIHNIKRLNEQILAYITIDDRLVKHYQPVIEYLDDYDIDPEGDAFRYATSTGDVPHMESRNITHISIDVFAENFRHLSDMIDDFIYFISDIIEEYSLNTFTKKLSRAQIAEISQLIGNLQDWTTSKDEIKSKYSIGAKELSEAVNIIKSHREFSANIGMESRFPSLDDVALSAYKEYIDGIEKITCTRKGKAPIGIEYEETTYDEEIMNKIEKVFLNKISYEGIITIAALIEISKRSLYSEQFDSVYKELYETYDQDSSRILYKLGYGNLHNRLLDGLKRCGQVTCYNEIC